MKAQLGSRPKYRRKAMEHEVQCSQKRNDDVYHDQLLRVVAQKKSEGYVPVHWKIHTKGVRVLNQEEGKIMIPARHTKSWVCMIHGNLVKVRHETYPDQNDRGVLILDVLPCLFCAKDALAVIQKLPTTRTLKTSESGGERDSSLTID